jgi:hypothetical protein
MMVGVRGAKGTPKWKKKLQRGRLRMPWLSLMGFLYPWKNYPTQSFFPYFVFSHVPLFLALIYLYYKTN